MHSDVTLREGKRKDERVHQHCFNNGNVLMYMGLLCGLPNANLDALAASHVPQKMIIDSVVLTFSGSCFMHQCLLPCLLLSLILSMACCALPGMARRLEFPSSTSPVHYPEGCAAHSMASTRPWRACIGLCMFVHWMLTDPNSE